MVAPMPGAGFLAVAADRSAEGVDGSLIFSVFLQKTVYESRSPAELSPEAGRDKLADVVHLARLPVRPARQPRHDDRPASAGTRGHVLQGQV